MVRFLSFECLPKFLMTSLIPNSQDDPSNTAFLLALLTAGGGLTGYIRTGSVPSVAAGVTVGALVRLLFPVIFFPFSPNPPQKFLSILRVAVRSRWLSHPAATTIWRGAGIAGQCDTSWVKCTQGDSVGETAADWVECCGGVWLVEVWDFVEGPGVRYS